MTGRLLFNRAMIGPRLLLFFRAGYVFELFLTILTVLPEKVDLTEELTKRAQRFSRATGRPRTNAAVSHRGHLLSRGSKFKEVPGLSSWPICKAETEFGIRTTLFQKTVARPRPPKERGRNQGSWTILSPTLPLLLNRG